jgi:hypothetical protein
LAFHAFSSKETLWAKVGPVRADNPQGRVEVRSDLASSHLKQVSALSRRGKVRTPIRPITGQHSLFAFSSAHCTVAIAYALVAILLQGWRCIGFTSFPKVSIRLASQTMGLGTFYPPHALRERIAVNDPQFQT